LQSLAHCYIVPTIERKFFPWNQPFFVGEISLKIEFNFFLKKSDFGGFQSPKVKGGKKNHKFLYLIFSKNIERMIKKINVDDWTYH